MKVSVLVKALVILFITVCSSCAILLVESWKTVKLDKYGIKFEMPGKPRQFTMKTQGYRGEQSYEEWILNEAETGNQYILIINEEDDKLLKTKPESWLLDNLEQPRIGFLDDAKEISKNRLYRENLPIDERYLTLKNKKKAVTHHLILNHLQVTLVFVYYDESNLETSGKRFLESIGAIKN